jgi:putative inorganic carbon (hco3(-)) transporter
METAALSSPAIDYPGDAEVASTQVDDSPAAGGGRCTIGFWLFILVNAALFIRPAEIVAGWENLQIYLYLIVASLAFSLPVVLPQLTWSSLRRNPITLCVIGLLFAIILSHLSHSDFYSARMGATEFGKVVIYYLLLVGLLDSPKRLQAFLVILFIFVLCTAGLSLLNHHGTIDIPSLSELEDSYGVNPETGEAGVIYRLRAMGIFNDPNDFALILNAAIFIGLHRLLEQPGRVLKVAWALPILPLLYALMLTRSRGGFLSLLAGLLVLLFTRVHWKRALLLAAVLLPALFLGTGGRLTNIDIENENDTAQGRVQLWRDSLVEFHSSPLLGIGEGTLADQIGHVTHNSYIHSYTELGLFGGTVFCGMFYVAVVGIAGLKDEGNDRSHGQLRSLRLCFLPVLAAYMTGMYSLSRTYANTTYVILGLSAASLAVAMTLGITVPNFGSSLVKRLVFVSIGCLIFFETFVRVFAQ